MDKIFEKLKGNDQTYGTKSWQASLLPAHMVLAVLLTALPLASSPASAGEGKSDRSDMLDMLDKPDSKSRFMFGQMFPRLPAYVAPDDTALTALTAAGPTTSPGPLFDANISAPIDPNDDNPNNVPSFFTYYGQFLDHV